MTNQSIERNALIETMEKIFDQIPIAIILVDKKMQIQLINKAFTRYLGYKKNRCWEKMSRNWMRTPDGPQYSNPKRRRLPGKHTFKNGKTAIVHRIPVLNDRNEVDYGFGMILFETIENMKEIIEKNRLLESKIKLYEEQLFKLNTTKYTWDSITGHSASIVKTKNIAKKASQTISNVLLTGKSGTGKELFAHAIHHGSKRESSPFVKINCAAIPSQLIESELFGYEPGSFTGARRKGKFELADKGSIFLDEIGDMPMAMQAKLLRVLQEMEFERIGGHETIKVDVRVIAATNKNLKKMYENSSFRYDLYFRLNVMTIEIPSLNERIDDMEEFINVLLEKLSCKLDKIKMPVSSEAMTCLKNYHWPGNIRELENILERAMILADRGPIIPDHLAIPIGGINSRQGSSDKLKNIMETTEKNAIRQCSIVFGSAIASLGGILYGMWLRYVDPESVLGVFGMVDYLLMVIIGGLGTLYGSIIGVAFFIITQAWLPDFLKTIAEFFPQFEIMDRLADRWMAFLGIFFIVAILVFPKGVVGTIRDKMQRHSQQHN